MIRDSTIYIDIDKITSVGDSSQYYNLSDKNFSFNKNSSMSQTLSNDIEIKKNHSNDSNDRNVSNDNESQNDISSSSSNIDYSLLYIRPPHTDNNNYLNYLRQSQFCSTNEILFEGYDNIFKENEKKFNLSLHFLNYQPKYLYQINKLMKKPVKNISFIQEPLKRIVKHYNFSNSFKSIYSFDEFYLNFGDKFNVGWTGKYDITNNYYSNYLGFKTKEEITVENVKEKYAFIFVAEMKELSLKKLNKILGIQKKNEASDLELNETKIQVNQFVKNSFIKQNELDYLLYDVCCKILQETEQELEPEQDSN